MFCVFFVIFYKYYLLTVFILEVGGDAVESHLFRQESRNILLGNFSSTLFHHQNLKAVVGHRSRQTNFLLEGPVLH